MRSKGDCLSTLGKNRKRAVVYIFTINRQIIIYRATSLAVYLVELIQFGSSTVLQWQVNCESSIET
jgi:hypothetical protein